MTEQTSNDNDVGRVDAREPDPHGQAAILLVESLMHGLIVRSIISVEDAIEIVGVATEVKEEIAEDMGDSPATMERSLTILKAISTSLANDVPGK